MNRFSALILAAFFLSGLAACLHAGQDPAPAASAGCHGRAAQPDPEPVASGCHGAAQAKAPAGCHGNAKASNGCHGRSTFAERRAARVHSRSEARCAAREARAEAKANCHGSKGTAEQCDCDCGRLPADCDCT